VKLTYDDLLLLPDDGMRHELIDGEHYVSPSPFRKHQALTWNLVAHIGPCLKERRVGRAFTAPYDVVFTKSDVVEPDLLFISAARLEAVLTKKHVMGAPDLVVEIESAGSQRDQGIKRALYERGVAPTTWGKGEERQQSGPQPTGMSPDRSHRSPNLYSG
jgi:Uma2 family endonuclease